MARIGASRVRTIGPARGKVWAALVFLLMAAGLLLGARPAHTATPITVDSTIDTAANDGVCSLREAIVSANTDTASGAAAGECPAGSGTDTISFNIPGGGVQTISPASPLPTITAPVTIDGTIQPGYAGSPIVELNGSGAGGGVDGLAITAGSSTVRGVAIYKFSRHGIRLETGDGNTVKGNYIGTDANGAVALGNSDNGVYVNASNNNVIGGSAPGEGNVISGNHNSGVRLNFTQGSVVQGNRIGTDPAGAADLGNFSAGVLLINASNCVIGGTAAGAGNVIAFNGPFNLDGGGVVVLSNGFNSILSNSIFSNNGLGIDLDDGTGFPLGGVTPNDSGDGDFGANSLQNFPVLTSATTSGGKTTTRGKLNSDAGQAFTVQYFSSLAADPSGNGEGSKFIGQKTVTTNANGNVVFAFKKKIPKGQFVTATATSSFGNTSEFSNARKVKRR